MRVLMVTQVGVRSSDAGLLLAQALQRLGCTVQIIPMGEDLPLWISLGTSRVRGRDPIFRASFGRYLFQQAAQMEADLVFLYGSNWCVSPGTIRRLRRKLNAKVILWELNYRLWRGYQAESVPIYDHLFSLDSYLVPVLRAAGARHVHHLPACADPEEHYPATLTAAEMARYAAEICFIGRADPERIAMLGQLTHRDLQVYGVGWRQVGEDLARRVSEEPVYGLKKTKIYAASKISINVHRPHMIHGENFRVFEVAACGGVSFSAYKPDLVACFEPEQEVVIFESAQELRRKVDHYLDRPDELAQISRAGRARVLAEHTYDHRARTILECV